MIFFLGLLCSCPTAKTSEARLRRGRDKSSAPDSLSSCSESDDMSARGTGDPGHDSDLQMIIGIEVSVRGRSCFDGDGQEDTNLGKVVGTCDRESEASTGVSSTGDSLSRVVTRRVCEESERVSVCVWTPPPERQTTSDWFTSDWQ